ncbi:glycosyltransferase family 4 protein [Sphingobium phenoxybenzoativorans]|uniref:glycosyltransferase family 4 protein n=1 Tax=Sphingobium phenoxybenzoativorans TaxID=1592790 RepID=UPI000872B92C|nr:glycosyltransferase family 4 protein [Sphingobium phenoxybenzoativorans]
MKHPQPDEFQIIPHHIAMIGNSTPRKCGIATFTTHCSQALAKQFPDMSVDHYALDDGLGNLVYADDIKLIAQNDLISYAEAAREIEESGAQAIWLQHEFGIFGGAAGDMILHLLARTKLPLVTTLHTILENPNPDELRVMRALLARSDQIIVMAERGREILRNHYQVDDARISLIVHGVPDRPYVEPAAIKPLLNCSGRSVILTFGLLAPDKGIDAMIRAMPAIVRAHPDALYVILGATHPNIVREQGESLRQSLQALACELGVDENVAFINQYVEQDELLDYLQASDIYVTPYVNPAQITSGTLSYAIGMGKPVISTPYVHATEILADGRGILVPFGDSEAMAHQISHLLTDPNIRNGYARRAYAYGRGMIWSELAKRVGRCLAQAISMQPTRLAPRRNYSIMEPDLSAILRMSDGTGMLQHSILSVPDRNHGYCIDDNARALILMTQIASHDDEVHDRWMTTYASFVEHAWNPQAGRFRNFMAFDRTWCEEAGSEDSSGRAIWALGVTARDATLPKHREWAVHLFDRSIGMIRSLSSPRARAFIMLGAAAMLEARPGDSQCHDILCEFGSELIYLLEQARRPDWAWFEAVLAYDNARLPHALLVAGKQLNNHEFIACGLSTLDWIVAQQTHPDGHFRAIGTESFGRAYSKPLPFDQQPLEAQATIEAAVAAYEVDKATKWIEIAENAYSWFLGKNELDIPLATANDGGCYDGLTPTGVNRNQGAESLLALQLASCAMNRLSRTLSAVAHEVAPEVAPASA